MNTNNGWLDIASAPKDGTPVLLFARHVYAESSTWVVGAYLLDWGWLAQSYAGQGSARLDPSHWMALPPFPAAPGSPASTVADEGAKDERALVMEAITEVWDHATRIDDATDEVIDILRPAPAAGDALDDETRWTLRWIMREADAAKETCSTDPESPAAIRNAKLAAIATAAAQALGLVRGPSYVDAGSGDAQDAARWRWIFSHAENVGFDYQSGRFTTLTIAGRQRESLVAFVDAAIAASQQGGE